MGTTYIPLARPASGVAGSAQMHGSLPSTSATRTRSRPARIWSTFETTTPL